MWAVPVGMKQDRQVMGVAIAILLKQSKNIVLFLCLVVLLESDTPASWPCCGGIRLDPSRHALDGPVGLKVWVSVGVCWLPVYCDVKGAHPPSLLGWCQGRDPSLSSSTVRRHQFHH